MNKLKSLLISLKIFDPDATLSLSNIAMMVLIGKLALAQSLDWTVLTAFFITLLNHNSKKWFAKSKAEKTTQDKDRLDQLETTIKSIATAAKLNNILK